MRARKLAAVTTVIIALTTLSLYAGTSVDWGFAFGMYVHGAPDLTDGTAGTTAVAANQAVLWELVLAGTSIDPVNAANGANGYVGGDDVVLSQRITPAGGGGGFAEWLTGTAVSENPTSFAGQLAFIRVFQGTTAVVGQWYYDSGTIVLNNIDITDQFHVPQTLEGNAAPTIQGDALNIQIVAVPEPSSIALVLVGLGIVGYRRIRRG